MVRCCQVVLVNRCMPGLVRGRSRAAACKLVGWGCSGYICPMSQLQHCDYSGYFPARAQNLWGQSLCFLGVYI